LFVGLVPLAFGFGAIALFAYLEKGREQDRAAPAPRSGGGGLFADGTPWQFGIGRFIAPLGAELMKIYPAGTTRARFELNAQGSRYHLRFVDVGAGSVKG